MHDVNCPYCNASQEIDHDDGYGFDESEIFEQQCHKCEKYFSFTTQISFHYTVRKADCLNDGEHQYEKTVTFPEEYLCCKACGDEQPLNSLDTVSKSTANSSSVLNRAGWGGIF